MSSGRLLTLRECSERTGHRESTWRAWVLHRRVPFYKVGRSVRIAEADLDEMIERARIPARELRRASA
jgi:excisionase family DNA binding protein